MRKSCIVFKKASLTEEMHNSRKLKTEAHYFLPQEFRKKNDFLKITDLHKVYDENMRIRSEKRMRGKAPDLKDNFYDAVVVLESYHTLDDVKKLADFIAQKYHFTTASIAIHRDEGHVNADKTVDYNYHAHICFVTLNDGQATKRLLKRQDLRDLQTACAEILHMQRGEKDSKAVRLEHEQYRYMKNELEKAKEHARLETKAEELKIFSKSTFDSLKQSVEILTLKEQKTRIEAERKAYKESHDHIAEEYRALQSLMKQRFTQEELDRRLDELRRAHKERVKKLLSEHKKEIELKNQELSSARLSAAESKERAVHEYMTKLANADMTIVKLSDVKSLKDAVASRDETIKSLQEKVKEQDTFIADLQRKLDDVMKTANALSSRQMRSDVRAQESSDLERSLRKAMRLDQSDDDVIVVDSHGVKYTRAMIHDIASKKLWLQDYIEIQDYIDAERKRIRDEERAQEHARAEAIRRDIHAIFETKDETHEREKSHTLSRDDDENSFHR